MGRAKTPSGTRRRIEPPIPREALEELEERLSRLRPQVTTKGWDTCPPLVRTPSPAKVRGAWFDVDAVVRVCRALTDLRQTKSPWAGRPLVPDPWQVVWVIAPIFGWKHRDGTRIIRTSWTEVPKKNGKSTISSGLALILLAADGEIGAEVYSAASGKDQAKYVFDPAKAMGRRSPALRAPKVQYLAEVIKVPRTGSIFRVLSRVSDIAHGINASGGVIDEVHILKSKAAKELVDAIEQGTASRAQPLILFITTADDGEQGTIYAEKREYVEKLASRVLEDPTVYGVIWAAEEDDDPFAEATWRKANPGLPKSPRLDYLKKEARKARVTPSYLPRFRRMHLNIRARPETRFLRLEDWDANGLAMPDPERLEGKEAYGGLDLSATQDLTAFVLVFPFAGPKQLLEEFGIRLPAAAKPGPGAIWLPRFWLPDDELDERVERDLVPYKKWADEGHLELTEGNVVDYDPVEAAILEAKDLYNLRRVSYDRMFAGQLINHVAEHVEVAPLGQTFLGLSPATKELERIVLGKRLIHGGHPVLRWMADNLEVLRDNHDNVKPVKPPRDKTSKRVDGMQAGIMGLDGWIRFRDEDEQDATLYTF